MSRPRRSALFVPADKPRALAKIGPALAADCVIIDLEDAVATEHKDAARAALAARWAALNFGHRERLLRINADRPAQREDLALAAELELDAVVVPKVESAAALEALAAALPAALPLWVMIESARGVLDAAAICAADAPLAALLVGTQDLGLDLRLAPGAGAELINHCLCQCLLAARASGLDAIDSVCPHFRDLAPLRAECEAAAARGFDGKAAIHPLQLPLINSTFHPDDDAQAAARSLLAAWDSARAAGHSVANWQGQMVEALHARQARALLARAAGGAAPAAERR